MKKIVKYEASQVYMYPNGELATADRVERDFPAVKHFTHIVETDGSGEVMFALQNLAAMRAMHDIDPGLPEAAAIAAIEAAVNAPPPEPEPTAEERIAAAMEYDIAAKLAEEGYAGDTGMAAKNLERGLWSPAMVAKALGPEAESSGLISKAELFEATKGAKIL